MKQEDLNKILNDHKLWLCDNGGVRADLRDADLCDADLRDADLCDANLRGAYLRDADLRGANLRGANLCDANLRGAYLRDADLRDADLCDADLRDADLRDADLCDADLRDADLRGADLCDADLCDANLRGADGINLACPESGAFVGFKKALCKEQVIVKLQITETAKRSSATGRKCRCNEAVVLEISDLLGINTDITEATSNHDKSFVYKVGEKVTVDNFDDNRFNECAAGIHFFITRQEAVEY